MRKNDVNKRLGYTLLECLIMISMLTALMTIALSWIHISMKFSKTIKQRATIHRQLARLSRELRSNITDADRFQIDGETLSLTDGATNTTYTISAGAIERKRRMAPVGDETVVNIEAFQIGSDVDAKWSTGTVSGQPDWVELTIRQRPVTTVSRDASKKFVNSVGSLETPKLELHLRASSRKASK